MESTNMQHNGTLQACPVCHASVDFLQTLVIGSTDERSITHVTCTHCSHTTMVYSALSDMGTVTFGVLTDMVASEAQDLMRADAISSDDVLSAHKYFQSAQVEAHVNRK